MIQITPRRLIKRRGTCSETRRVMTFANAKLVERGYLQGARQDSQAAQNPGDAEENPCETTSPSAVTALENLYNR